MQGEISFQISGEISEKSKEVEISPEDIKTVMEKTNCSEKKAKETQKKIDEIDELEKSI